MKPDAKLLEICCGDGFNARHFYSSRAASIIAIDFDKTAIPHAKRFNAAPNITYIQQDIREGLPPGPFDNIVWDTAIEHFTEVEVDQMMRELVQRLGPYGILSGYTLSEAADGRKSNALHEYEFKDKEDLRRFFTPHFKHVKVWETIYPTTTFTFSHRKRRSMLLINPACKGVLRRETTTQVQGTNLMPSVLPRRQTISHSLGQ